MIQPLSTYGYRENEYMKPTSCNYEVTISSNDHVITIEDNGDLLASLGLELVNQTLSLIGKDGEAFASVDLPSATGIENIKYDKATHSLVITVKKDDGGTEDYILDISDLVDVYQSGNGIEIAEDAEGNKTINVKINEGNKDVLSADENGLAIDLSQYAKSSDITSCTEKVAELSENLEDEIQRATKAENELSQRLDEEVDRASKKENMIANNLAILNNNVAESITQLNNNIATITNELNSTIQTEIQRATNRENEIEEKIGNFAKQEDLDQTNLNLATLNNNVVAITNTLNENLATEINRALVRENELQDGISQNSVKNNDQDVLINTNTESIRAINEAMNGLYETDTQQWESITNHTQRIDEMGGAITSLQETDTQQWGAITNHTQRIDEMSGAITSLQETDTQQWGAITSLQDTKMDKEDGKGLSSNDFTDEYKQELDDLDVNVIYSYIDAADSSLSDKIDAVNAVLEKKVDQDAYDAKVAGIEQEMAGMAQDITRVESLIPSVDGLASEEWVKAQGYLTETALEPYSTTEEIKDICVTEKEYATYEKDLLINIDATYAKKDEVPSIDGLASEEWVQAQGYLTEHQDLSEYAKTQDVVNSFATKTELNDGLATKVSATEATEITKEYVDNKLNAYTPTTGIAEMIDSAVAEGKSEAVSESQEYADGKLNEAEEYAEGLVDTLRENLETPINQNANELKILSTCNDGKVYDETKAMQGGTSNGVVDELYRLLHTMLKNVDENDLGNVNKVLALFDDSDKVSKMENILSSKSVTKVEVENNTLIIE